MAAYRVQKNIHTVHEKLEQNCVKCLAVNTIRANYRHAIPLHSLASQGEKSAPGFTVSMESFTGLVRARIPSSS